MIELRVLGPPALDGVAPADARTVLRQPRRSALLVRLAMTPRGGFERRDRLLATFWPEHDDERARHALRQALHVLRLALGRDLFLRRGDDELAVNPDALRCDAAELERLLDAGALEEALALYRDDLLPGFFVPDAPEFERWLEETRARLRTRAAAAAAQLATTRERAGDVAATVRWAARAHDLAPDDEGALRRLIAILAESGNRAEALQTYARFARRVADSLDVEPSAETQALVQALRARGAGPRADASVTPATATAPATAPARAPDAVPTETLGYVAPVVGSPPATDGASRAPVRPRRERRGLVAAAATVALAVAVALFARADGSAGHPAPPVQSRETVRAPRAVAQRLYAEALRAHDAGDDDGAERLLRAAVAEDSTYGLAVLQLGHLMGLRGAHAEAHRIQASAVRLAPRQSDHDRLSILAAYADRYDAPKLRAVAETLAIRYPDDVDGQRLVAKARVNAGDFLGAVEPLRRVIAAAGTRGPAAAGRCEACGAYSALVEAYEWADSLPAAERTARAWIAARPRDPAAWMTLSYQLSIQDRHVDAIAAARRASDLDPGVETAGAVGGILLRAGDFETLDRILDVRMVNGDRDARDDARFLRWRSLRERGRFDEALAVADRALRDERAREEPSLVPLILRTQSLTDLGRFAAAARVWDSLAASVRDRAEPPASVARMRAAHRANLAGALAELRDTVRLARLVDSVRIDAGRSGVERTRRLHLHVLGLLHAARGDSTAACDALVAARYSATSGYVKNYLAAARVCLAAGRPAEVVRAARSVVRGPIGASGTTATFAEAHAHLARAFEALGMRDSARAHRQRVGDAWAPVRLGAAAAGGSGTTAPPPR